MTEKQACLKRVSEQFDIDTGFVSAVPYGSGHINDTYLSALRSAEGCTNYIIQRINHKIFVDPPSLMDNIVRVSTHVRQKLAAVAGSDPKREALTVIPTRDGRSYWLDDDGSFWRVYIFITGAKTYDICESLQHALEAAKAIGQFQGFLADLPGGPLHETIPFFHHTPRRFEALERAVDSDLQNRCAKARDLIDFCLSRRSLASSIISMLEAGTMPRRVCHNDAKFNNVMIDDATGRGICVIDLDTVMNGSAVYDFGDMVRTITLRVAEDERDLSKVGLDIAFFEALVKGYLSGARSFLTRAELEALPLAGKVITFTIGIRFLTDYLSGDVYFKTHRDGHNLDRARVQFKLLESMERLSSRMDDVLRRYL